MRIQQINASVRIPKPLHERMVSLAQQRQRTPHALMLMAIETYINREEKREALRREARNAHDEYVRTGLHLNNAEVVDWMDKIIQGEKIPMLSCHM